MAHHLEQLPPLHLKDERMYRHTPPNLHDTTSYQTHQPCGYPYYYKLRGNLMWFYSSPLALESLEADQHDHVKVCSLGRCSTYDRQVCTMYVYVHAYATLRA